MSAWGMLKQGHVIGAIERVWDTVLGTLPAPVAAFVKKVVADEGNILVDAAENAAKNVIANGLSTASFTTAAAGMAAEIAAKGLTVATTDIYAALNISVGSQVASAAQATPTPGA